MRFLISVVLGVLAVVLSLLGAYQEGRVTGRGPRHWNIWGTLKVIGVVFYIGAVYFGNFSAMRPGWLSVLGVIAMICAPLLMVGARPAVFRLGQRRGREQDLKFVDRLYSARQ
jgi:hypothetical protein